MAKYLNTKEAIQMVNKHVQRHLISLVTEKKANETFRRHLRTLD